MVKDNPQRHRFELDVEGNIAFAAYRREGRVITFTHTEVPDALQRKGVGSALAKGALDLVRQSGGKVIPRCPFIAAYMQKHPEFEDLLAVPDSSLG